ncbi:MAG: 3-deoxy-manno-octulosonate cytidylyltransferase [Bacteriovoracia bacterium]
MSVCIVIPARLGSTRLSEKVLAPINGKPMIQHVYERTQKVRGVDLILVATDNQKIVDVVEGFGGKAVMTPEALNSGTDRVAFVASARDEDIFINVQGDEPMLDPQAVQDSLELVRSKRFVMATPAARLRSEEDLRNPNVVKVLVRKDGAAVYFSRYPIPYSRVQPTGSEFSCLHHLGVYVYTKETLLAFSKLPRTQWEVSESLEQLRAVYHGIPIGIAEVETASRGVDTAEDLEFVRQNL